jgi:hypothetical protein
MREGTPKSFFVMPSTNTGKFKKEWLGHDLRVKIYQNDIFLTISSIEPKTLNGAVYC